MKIRERYFKDYNSYNVLKENGEGKKTISVYEGDVYILDAKDKQRLLKKPTCACLIVLYFLLGLAAGFQNVSANKGCFSIPYIGALICGLYCLLGVINLLICKKDMTEFEYKEYKNQIERGSTMAIFMMGVTTIIYLVFLIIALVGSMEMQSVVNELIAFICGCASCGCISIILLIEKKSKYIVVPGKASSETKADTDN